jgi:hypothetical protein
MHWNGNPVFIPEGVDSKDIELWTYSLFNTLNIKYLKLEIRIG